MPGCMRANPQVALRAVGSRTRSGWALNDPSVQSSVLCGILTVSTWAAHPASSRALRGSGGADPGRCAASRGGRPPVPRPSEHSQDRPRRVNALVSQRKPARAGPNRRRQIAWSLRSHHVSRLDRDHMAISRLVRAGSLSDVHNNARLAESTMDTPRKSWIFAAGPGIPASPRSRGAVRRSGRPGHRLVHLNADSLFPSLAHLLPDGGSLRCAERRVSHGAGSGVRAACLRSQR